MVAACLRMFDTLEFFNELWFNRNGSLPAGKLVDRLVTERRSAFIADALFYIKDPPDG